MNERTVLHTFELTAAMSAIALAQLATTAALAADPTPSTPEVVVTSTRGEPPNPAATELGTLQISPKQLLTRDSARFLQDVPGVALSGAGGISSLPVIHGLADDRNRIDVDGMGLISSCGNHMNPPLSYVDPDSVSSVSVYTGAAPVSVGGDSIGGSILVRSAPPRFAESADKPLLRGELGGSYRSNSNAHGVSATATIATQNLGLTYRGSVAEADNYHAAKDFKPTTLAQHTARGDHVIDGDEVGSSAYRVQSSALQLAARSGDHMVVLDGAIQRVPYQGFPNQHMDMTDNVSKRVNLGYSGAVGWGTLEARIYHEETRHEMDFGDDKLYWYGPAFNVAGMPMFTHGRTLGLQLKTDIVLNARDTLRVGTEYQRYRLDDYWTPVANSMMMSPNTFWNVRDGQRDRFDVFSEWEAAWGGGWSTLAGVRSSTVRTDAGPVQGYNNIAMMYGNDAARFNASDRSVTDHNIDFSAIARYAPGAMQSYEAGIARKTRSPSLYERYTWSTNGMAMTMNNWLNDGNGYVGDIELEPEVAHTVSLAADLHDAQRSDWQFKAMVYYTHVDNYIDAECLNTCAADQFNYLKLVNVDARLYGIDLSGFAPLGRIEGVGNFTGRFVVGYVNGKNTTSGDRLYNIMPLNARLTLEHRRSAWSNAIELVLVGAKNDVSEVRNEIETGGYALLNLRTSYAAKHLRIDLGIDNALDKQYAHPLGGAYIGQGATMSLNGAGAPYGIAVPGMGRSIYVAVNAMF